MADTMLHQSHPLAALAAGLVAEAHEPWRHLEPLRFAGARRRLTEVRVTSHPGYPVRVPAWRHTERHSTYSR